MAGWNSIYRRTERQYPTARVMRSGINLLDDLKKKRPFFLGVDAFDPHEPLDAPQAFQLAPAAPRGSSCEGITPIQPFETPYSWAVDVDVDDPTLQRVRELYAAEITFVDEWIGRLMNELDDQKLLDETVVYYISDHGLTLGENGILGKHGARAQWHIYHVPCMIRHPEGKLRRPDERLLRLHARRGRRPCCRSWASGAPGLMDGEDLSVLFDGRPAAGPALVHLLLRQLRPGRATATGSSSRTARAAASASTTSSADPRELSDVAAEHPQIVDRLWKVLADEAGGTLPQFGPSGAKAVIGG